MPPPPDNGVSRSRNGANFAMRTELAPAFCTTEWTFTTDSSYDAVATPLKRGGSAQRRNSGKVVSWIRTGHYGPASTGQPRDTLNGLH
jgi:hypothetical protein